MKKPLTQSLSQLTIKKRVIIGTLIILIITLLITNIMYIIRMKQLGTNGIVQKARSITMMAESFRRYQAKNWDRNIYQKKYLMKDLNGKFIYTVPVYSAIITMTQMSKKLGYVFRVPKFKPRNPANKPTEKEGKILKKMKAEGLSEYTMFDSDKNDLRYFSAVKLSKDCLLCHGNPARSKELWGRDDGRDPTGGVMEGWKAGEMHGAFEVVCSMNDFYKSHYRMIAINVLSNILLIIAALVLIRMVVKKALNPLDNIAASLDEINKGTGDLTKRIEVLNNDEVGAAALMFNRFLDQLKEMILAIKTASDHVDLSSQEMKNSSENLAQESQRQAASIEETSTAMEEIKATIDSVSDNAKQQAKKAGDNKSLMEHLSNEISIINDSAQKANNIANETHEYAIDGEKILGQTVNSIKEIYESSDKIREIVTIISDISDQINLLSLNASIEAARAGDHGKGFAVVAEEISKLADQTANSSSEINRLIQESNEKINIGSELMEKTVLSLRKIIGNVKATATIMESIADSSLELNSTGTNVADNAGKVNIMSEEISAMMEEQSSSSNEILKAINLINDITQGVASGSEELAASAEELTAQSDLMKEIVAKFRIDDTDDTITEAPENEFTADVPEEEHTPGVQEEGEQNIETRQDMTFDDDLPDIELKDELPDIEWNGPDKGEQI